MPPPIGSLGGRVTVPPVSGGTSAPTAPVASTTPVASDSFDLASASRFELSQGKTLSANDLATLKRAGKGELATIIGQAQKTYASLLAQGAKLVVTTSPGNGNKPVLAIVPPSLARNTDAAQPYKVHVHYHGMGSTAASPSGESPLVARIARSFSDNPPTVFVLPHSATLDKATPKWSNVKDTGRTAADAVAGLTGTRAELTVSAHSLGRRAIESALASGGLVADRLDIQDAFYRTQPEGPRGVKAWMDAHPEAKVRVLITSNSMSDAATIQRQANFPPGTVVVDHPKRGHFDAELKPW
jgi:hypothetical protein